MYNSQTVYAAHLNLNGKKFSFIAEKVLMVEVITGLVLRIRYFYKFKLHLLIYKYTQGLLKQLKN